MKQNYRSRLSQPASHRANFHAQTRVGFTSHRNEGLFQQTQVLVEVGPEILPVGLGSHNEVFDLKLGSTQMGLIRCLGTPIMSTQVCSGEGGPALWDPCLGNASQE